MRPRLPGPTQAAHLASHPAQPQLRTCAPAATASAATTDQWQQAHNRAPATVGAVNAADDALADVAAQADAAWSATLPNPVGTQTLAPEAQAGSTDVWLLDAAFKRKSGNLDGSRAQWQVPGNDVAELEQATPWHSSDTDARGGQVSSQAVRSSSRHREQTGSASSRNTPMPLHRAAAGTAQQQSAHPQSDASPMRQASDVHSQAAERRARWARQAAHAALAQQVKEAADAEALMQLIADTLQARHQHNLRQQHNRYHGFFQFDSYIKHTDKCTWYSPPSSVRSAVCASAV